MTQEERLDYLLKAFIVDSNDYKKLEIPDDISENVKFYALMTYNNHKAVLPV